MKIMTNLKNPFVAISTKFCGNIDENPVLFKKKHENNGNVEKFRGIIHPYVVVAFVVLREILDCFLLFHEVMADPILKQHPEVLFLLETLPTQSESVYPSSLKS
jgi:hypothetical protein